MLFAPGRTDASPAHIDVTSLAVPEPDGFRNYQRKVYHFSADEMLVDKAQRLTLCAPEMTVLVGCLRMLGANTGARSANIAGVQRPVAGWMDGSAAPLPIQLPRAEYEPQRTD